MVITPHIIARGSSSSSQCHHSLHIHVHIQHPTRTGTTRPESCTAAASKCRVGPPSSGEPSVIIIIIVIIAAKAARQAATPLHLTTQTLPPHSQ